MSTPGDIRNISNNGLWSAGTTQSFEVYITSLLEFWYDGNSAQFSAKTIMAYDGDPEGYPDSSGPILWEDSGGLTGVNGINAFIDDSATGFPGAWTDYPSSQTVAEGWRVYTLTIPENIQSGVRYILTRMYGNNLPTDSHSEWLGDIIQTAQVTLVVATPSIFVPNPLVPDRPPDYDPDLGWDEANSVWTPTARGGGRYKQQLVAVGKDGEIYYGDVG